MSSDGSNRMPAEATVGELAEWLRAGERVIVLSASNERPEFDFLDVLDRVLDEDQVDHTYRCQLREIVAGDGWVRARRGRHIGELTRALIASGATRIVGAQAVGGGAELAYRTLSRRHKMRGGV